MTRARTFALSALAFTAGAVWGYRHGWRDRTRTKLRLEQRVDRFGARRVVDARGEWHGD